MSTAPLSTVRCLYCAGVCMCQVSGRLHVEVWRGTEGSQEGDSELSDAQQNITDGESQERKLECVVRTKSLFNSI